MTKSLPSLKFRRSRRDTIAPSEEVSPTRDRLLDDGITHDSDELYRVHIHGLFLRVLTDGQLVVSRKHP